MTPLELLTLLLAALAVVIALLSAMRARIANETAKDAYRLAERAFSGERKGQVRTTRTDGGKLELEPLSQDTGLNQVQIIFPSVLGINAISVSAPRLYFYESTVLPALQRYWESRTPCRAGHAVVRHGSGGTLPVAIKVHAFTKGEATVSIALYDLRTTFVRKPRDDGTFSSSTTVEALVFNNALPDGIDPLPVIDNVMSSSEPTTKVA